MAAHSILYEETVASGTTSYEIPWDDFAVAGDGSVDFIFRGDHTEELKLQDAQGRSLYVPSAEAFVSGPWSEDRRAIRTIERGAATAFTYTVVLLEG